MSARVLLKSPLNPVTGYGRDGLALALALEKAGCHVMLSPISVAPPLTREVAAMLTRPLEPPFDILLNHVDPGQLGITAGERKSAYRSVAWTMWEFLGMEGQEWEPTLAQRLERFDTVLSYDETTAGALRPYVQMGASGASKPAMVLLQGGYDPDLWKSEPKDRDWSGTIRFGMAGVLNTRKNPFAAIRAFEKVHAQYPDTELHLKTNDRTLHPGIEGRYEGVKIHYAFWSDAQMLEFYRGIHAYVGPSWGEGKNLPAIEAATTGAVPIVSNCGGHRMWADDSMAYLTPGTYETVSRGLVGLKVDEAALAEQMIQVITHRDEARAKGELASRVLPTMMNWDAVVRRLLAMVAG